MLSRNGAPGYIGGELTSALTIAPSLVSSLFIVQSNFLLDITNDGISIQSAMAYYVPPRISKFGSPNQLLYSTKLFKNIFLLTTNHSFVIIAVFSWSRTNSRTPKTKNQLSFTHCSQSSVFN